MQNPNDLEGKTVEQVRFDDDEWTLTFSDGTELNLQAKPFQFSIGDEETFAQLNWSIR